MKHIIAILLLVSVPSSFAGEDSADDIAKRVIVDKSSAHILIPDASPASYVPPRHPEEDQLAAAAMKSYDSLTAYILSDAVPEKIRLAYAIRVLAGKRVPKSSIRQFGAIDTRINDGYLKDGLILAARLAEIEKAEQGGAGQPATAPESKSEGSEKPKSESEGRSQ